VQRAADYAAEDADITLRLHRTLWPKLEAEPKLRGVFEQIEMPLVPVLARMEQTGVLIDATSSRRKARIWAGACSTCSSAPTPWPGVTSALDSPKQLQMLLYDELKLPATFKTPTGQPSTNEEALEALASQHELPRLILDYRGMAKLRSTYTDKLAEHVNPRTGRVHTSYHQAVAQTGRLSSNEPNLQNIPIRTEDGRRIRQAFVARRDSRSSLPIIRRSSCASWRTCPATPDCSLRSTATRTCTARPPPRCSACRRNWSSRTSGARPRRSTSA
jgi:DNA polymerase-1